MAIDFLRLLKALSAAGVDFVIIGGVAARLHGSTRLTHDIDIVPSLTPDSWKRTIDVLWDNGGRPRIPETKETIRDVKNIRTWMSDKGMLALSFRSDDGLVEVDLVVSESTRFDELKQRALRVDLDGHAYFVASLSDLLAMKRAAARPQDLLDIAELEEIARRLKTE